MVNWTVRQALAVTGKTGSPSPVLEAPWQRFFLGGKSLEELGENHGYYGEWADHV